MKIKMYKNLDLSIFIRKGMFVLNLFPLSFVFGRRGTGTAFLFSLFEFILCDEGMFRLFILFIIIRRYYGKITIELASPVRLLRGMIDFVEEEWD